LTYALNSVDYSQYISGSTRDKLTQEDMWSINVSLPALDEQRRIADFLDAETARIDALMSDKDRLLAVLDERSMALVSRFCLRGLRSEVSMRDSSIGPLGTIPRHWEVVRNKNLFVEVVELSTSGEEELLTVSHITGVTPRSEKNVYMFRADSLVGYKKCQVGDLVVNTLWAWMGALGISKNDGIVSPAYGVYRLTSGSAVADYLDFLYRTREYVCEMTRYSKGCGRPGSGCIRNRSSALAFRCRRELSRRRLLQQLKVSWRPTYVSSCSFANQTPCYGNGGRR
jgi:type I restriction enzyme, S subunit